MSQTNARFVGGAVILPQGANAPSVNVGEKALVVQADGTAGLLDSLGAVAAVGGACKLVVRLVSTSNIASLTGTPTIDSIATNAGDRVLLVGQTTASQNGIYVVAAGAWARSTDYNQSAQMSPLGEIGATNGAVWQFSTWALTNTGAIVVDSTSLVFKPIAVDLDPVAGVAVCSQAQIGLASVSIFDAGNGSTNAQLSAFSMIGLIRGITAGLWIGGIGYKNLTDTTGWYSIQGAQGKMTGVPANLSLSNAFPGHLALTPDLTNFKLYGFDGQTGGSWKCYGEAYTARKRGADLTDTNQTIQPFTDKASRYDRVIALTANRTTTLGTTGVLTGTKVMIVRRDTAAFTNAIVNGGGGGGTLLTFAASPTEVQRATFRFDGTNWALGDFEYIEA